MNRRSEGNLPPLGLGVQKPDGTIEAFPIKLPAEYPERAEAYLKWLSQQFYLERACKLSNRDLINALKTARNTWRKAVQYEYDRRFLLRPAVRLSDVPAEYLLRPR